MPPEVKVVLTAEDQGVAAAIRELGRQLDTLKTKQEQTGASSQKLAQNFRSLSQQALETVRLRIANIPGLGNLGSTLAIRAYEPVGKMLEESAGELENRFGGAALAVGGLGGALVALGAIALGVTHHMMDLAQSIENTAAATGLTTDQVQVFDELAKEMGVSSESVETAFSRMQVQIGEFLTTGKSAGEGSQNLIRVLQQMGVALIDSHGNARQAVDVMSDFYNVLNKIPNAEERVAIESVALGTRGRVIAQMFDEARREGISFQELLEKIERTEGTITPEQLDWLEDAKQKFEDATRVAGGYLKQLGVLAAFMTTHPMESLRAFEQRGGVGAVYAETLLPRPGAPKPETQAQKAATAALRQILDENNALGDQLAILRAGGKLQHDLALAEQQRAIALKQRDGERVKALDIQMRDLREIITLEAARKKPKREKPFGEEEGARAERAQFERYNRRVEEGKRAMQGLLTIENELTRAESESARQALEEQAAKLRGEQHLEEERQRELTQAKQEAARLGAQIAEQGGDKTYELRAQLDAAEANAAKAASLGEMQLSAAYAKQVDELKTLIQAQQQMITGSQALHTISQSMQSGMQTLFDSIGRGAGSVREAFGQMEMAVIHSLENVATQMLANLALALMTDNLQKLSKAKLAAANTFASVSAIPVIGWILAPVAAAAAFAETLQFASGGLVRGPGGPTSDRVPAMLSNGEFVVHAGAVKSFGADNLEAINAGIRTVSPEFMSSIARPADFRTPSFELPEAVVGAGAKNLHSYEEIHLHHSGPDALQVLREQLLPEIRDAFRRGELDFMRQP